MMKKQRRGARERRGVREDDVTINAPVIYMAQDIMILCRQIHYKGHWKGWALKIETFLGPERTKNEASDIWAHVMARVMDFCILYAVVCTVCCEFYVQSFAVAV